MEGYRFFAPQVCLRIDDEEGRDSPFTVSEIVEGINHQDNEPLRMRLNQLDWSQASLVHFGRDDKPKEKPSFAYVVAPLDTSHHGVMEDQSVEEYVADLQDLLLPAFLPDGAKNYLVGKQNLTFVMLNWYIRGATGTSGMPIGGPGAVPKVTADPSLNSLHQAPDPRVHVYVLDTLPWNAYVDANDPMGEQTVRNMINQHSDLLKWWENVVTTVSMEEVLTSVYNQGGNTGNSSFLEGFKEAGSTVNSGLYANHGLFITDIVHQIAPQAKITLVEAMNHRLWGSIDGYIALTAWLRNKIASDPAIKIFVNMSFTWDIPAFGHNLEDAIKELIDCGIESHEWAQLKEQWQKTLENLKDLEKAHYEDDVQRMVTDLANMVKDIKSEVIFYAASGNNSGGDCARRVARYPARAEGIVGVGASNTIGSAVYADYSNEADSPVSHGIVEWGGSRSNNGGKFESTGGMVGAYLGDVGNTKGTGYVEWSGTSFATARATALKAQEALQSLP